MEGLGKMRVKTKVSMPIINSGLATDQATPNDMFRYRIRKSLSTRFCSRKIRLLLSMPLALMGHARYSTCKYAKSLYARRFGGSFHGRELVGSVSQVWTRRGKSRSISR